MLKIGFVGFRHSHILQLYDLCLGHQDIRICASCEEDAQAREKAMAHGVEFTHVSYESLFQSADCDAIATAEAFGIRGRIVIEALQLGKHVISDKPLCTNLNEWEEIARLASEKGLKVGCMFTRRDLPATIGSRNVIREGTLGQIHAIHFNGQHPLLLGSRPKWYFQPGLHGGTINDIAIHAMDFIPWVTGLEFHKVNAARSWNAFAKEFPHFEDAGQMMLTMDNGAGVLGDVSYFAVDGMAYESPYYWRTSYFGENGILETSQNCDCLHMLLKQDDSIREIPLPKRGSGHYLESFLRDVRGNSEPDDLNTASVLKASRLALMIQKAADQNIADMLLI